MILPVLRTTKNHRMDWRLLNTKPRPCLLFNSIVLKVVVSEFTASVRKPNVLQGIIDNLIYYSLLFKRAGRMDTRLLWFAQSARALSGEEISAIDV